MQVLQFKLRKKVYLISFQIVNILNENPSLILQQFTLTIRIILFWGSGSYRTNILF